MKFHFYEIKIDRKHIYRLLNCCRGLKIRNIVNNENLCEFKVDSTEYNNLLYILDKNDIKIKDVKEKGMYAIIAHKFFIKFSLMFCSIFIMLLAVNSMFIWKISVEGNYSYTSDAIISFLNKENIREGIKKNTVDCDKLERKIREKYNDISWVCCEIKGTNLLVHVKENYITEIATKEQRPYHIVANRNAEITSILVKSGTAKVKTGDKIKKGTILISGLVDVFDESEQKIFTTACAADGEIYGKTKYSYKDTLNQVYNKKIYTNIRTYYIPVIKGYRWIKKSNKNENTEYSIIDLKGFGNYYLPLCIEKYRIKKYKSSKSKYSENEAKNILMSKLTDKLAIMEQKGYKILKKNVKITKENDKYICSGIISCQEPLGKVVYIDENTLKDIATEQQNYNETATTQ